LRKRRHDEEISGVGIYPEKLNELLTIPEDAMRAPDLTIGPASNPQTLRWHLFRAFGWQLALHRWLRSDDDRALHDHRSWSLSLILTGGYWEVTSHAWEPLKRTFHGPSSLIWRTATQPHRVLLKEGTGPVWTLWLRGKGTRDWGFWCPKGWRPFHEYIDKRDYSAPGSTSEVGKGCD
jgi:hypothetical protein